MATVRVSAKGWVVIPAELRRKYQIEPGAEVAIVDYGGVLAVVPEMRDPVADARGTLKGDESLTRALQRDRDHDKNREDRC